MLFGLVVVSCGGFPRLRVKTFYGLSVMTIGSRGEVKIDLRGEVLFLSYKIEGAH